MTPDYFEIQEYDSFLQTYVPIPDTKKEKHFSEYTETAKPTEWVRNI